MGTFPGRTGGPMGYISDRQKIAFLPYCACSGDHWSPANLPQQRIFWDSFLAKQTGTGEQCSPLQEFFDSLIFIIPATLPECKAKRCVSQNSRCSAFYRFIGNGLSAFCAKFRRPLTQHKSGVIRYPQPALAERKK